MIIESCELHTMPRTAGGGQWLCQDALAHQTLQRSDQKAQAVEGRRGSSIYDADEEGSGPTEQ